MLAPIALHAAPPARPAPPVAADTALRDSNLVHLNALSRAVVDTLEARGVKSPSGSLVVWVGVGGAGAQLNVLKGNVPDALRASVGPVMTAYVRRRGMDTPLAFTIRLENVVRSDGPMPPEGAEEMPRLRNAGKVSDYLRRILQAHPELKRGVHRAVVDMQVNREGRVAIVYVREWSGAAEVDMYLAMLGNEMEFTPGRVGGVPVATWIRLPLSFHTSR